MVGQDERGPLDLAVLKKERATSGAHSASLRARKKSAEGCELKGKARSATWALELEAMVNERGGGAPLLGRVGVYIEDGERRKTRHFII